MFLHLTLFVRNVDKMETVCCSRARVRPGARVPGQGQHNRRNRSEVFRDWEAFEVITYIVRYDRLQCDRVAAGLEQKNHCRVTGAASLPILLRVQSKRAMLLNSAAVCAHA